MPGSTDTWYCRAPWGLAEGKTYMGNRSIVTLCLLSIVTLGGCGSLEQSICDKRIICEGGNDKDRSACVDRYNGQTHVAAAYGCTDAWRQALSCLDTTGTCTNSRFGNSACDAQLQVADACQTAAASPNFR